MENIKIVSQGRKCYNGRKYVEFFNVIADTERFGKAEIMFQGTFEDCVKYLEREGYSYQRAALVANGKSDVQIANRMFRVDSFDADGMHLTGRDGWSLTVNLEEMKPISPNCFRLPWSPAKGTTSTMKLGDARTW